MSSLAKYAHLMREPHDEHARAAARAAYHEHGLVLINPAWITSWAQRQELINIANSVHGKRKNGAGI